MLTSARCQELASHFKALSQASDISEDRAFLLKNIARSLTGLTGQLDRLATMIRAENRVGSAQKSERPQGTSWLAGINKEGPLRVR
jgi:hypothetical protein